MQIAVENLLKDPGGALNRVFRPKPDELVVEGIEFSKKPIRVEIELQNAAGVIIGNLQVACELTFECARCVERFAYGMQAARQIEYVVNPAPEKLEAESAGWFVSPYDGEAIVLDEDVRQMLILEIPMKLICREDCRGLCPKCGANLNDGACACAKRSDRPPTDNPFRSAFNDLIRKKKL